MYHYLFIEETKVYYCQISTGVMAAYRLPNLVCILSYWWSPDVPCGFLALHCCCVLCCDLSQQCVAGFFYALLLFTVTCRLQSLGYSCYVILTFMVQRSGHGISDVYKSVVTGLEVTKVSEKNYIYIKKKLKKN